MYLKVAEAAERELGPDTARQVLEEGLAKAPRSSPGCIGSSPTSTRGPAAATRRSRALELGLKVMPEDLHLRWQLAMLLASRGEAKSGRLGMEIEELKRVGISRPFIQYLTACYHFNKGEFLEADGVPDVAAAGREADTGNKGEGQSAPGPVLRGDRRQRAAAGRGTNGLQHQPEGPGGPAGVDRGAAGSRATSTGRCRECQELHKDGAGVGLLLADLLIDRNLRLPEAEQGLDGGGRATDRPEAAAAPDVIGPALLRPAAAGGGRGPGAGDEGGLRQDRDLPQQFPKDPAAWTTRAEMLIRQGESDERKYDEARALLDRAQRELGDRIELRLSRMLLISSRGGPQVVPALNELGRGLEAFSREERRRLLTVLAAELGRQQDREGAADACGTGAGRERVPRTCCRTSSSSTWRFQAGDSKKAEEQIRKVGELSEDYVYLCRARLLVWQGTTPAPRHGGGRGKARAC